MESAYEIASVPIIVVVVYVCMAIYRKIVEGKAEVWTNLIPLWAALIGAAIGVALFWAAPDLIPADNFVVALAIGLVSGLGATGVNQVGKQLKKLDTATNTATTADDQAAGQPADKTNETK